MGWQSARWRRGALTGPKVLDLLRWYRRRRRRLSGAKLIHPY
jgi:hypothetical protein